MYKSTSRAATLAGAFRSSASDTKRLCWTDNPTPPRLRRCDLALSGQGHALRPLQVGAELVEEARGQLVVHQPSVAGQRHRHQLLGAERLALLAQPQLRAGRAHGQDARLGRVDDGAEAADAKHAQVGDTAGSDRREKKKKTKQ